MSGFFKLAMIGFFVQSLTLTSIGISVAGAEEARGLVRSSARIEVRSDLSAAVARADFGDGMRFQEGDTLVEFDCSRYRAELNGAKAAAHAASIELGNQRRLFKHGATGKSDVQLAQAEAARTNAEAKARAARVKECTITAPFSGRVVSLNTRAHEMPSPSEPVIVVLDDSVLELELVLPSKWLVWLKPDQTFRFRVDETGKTYSAHIDRLGAEVDPVSQTIKAYGRLKGDHGGVLAGMSGVAHFSDNGS